MISLRNVIEWFKTALPHKCVIDLTWLLCDVQFLHELFFVSGFQSCGPHPWIYTASILLSSVSRKFGKKRFVLENSGPIAIGLLWLQWSDTRSDIDEHCKICGGRVWKQFHRSTLQLGKLQVSFQCKYSYDASYTFSVINVINWCPSHALI